MEGPYILTQSSIDQHVTRVSPGFYQLHYPSGTVKYVGRSDTDIAARLKVHVPQYYTAFAFEYAGSAKAAFEGECRHWHRHGGAAGSLDNKNHPARPPGSGWKCPVCDIFG